MNPNELRRWIPKVKHTPTCWLWTASTSKAGYGRMCASPKSAGMKLAHRLSYEHFRGPIPAGLEIDHVCRVRNCVNPRHLRAVTHRDNLLAPGSKSFAATYAAKTHCPRGHEYTPENTDTRRGRRECRKCMHAAYKSRWRRRCRREAP